MSVRVPVIAVVGWSGSGKTTFLVKVVAILREEGLRVGIIKHSGHARAALDVEGKDSWRYGQVGADPVVVSSGRQYTVIRDTPRPRTLDELAGEIADTCDVIIAEGFRHEASCVIEFRRAAFRDEPIMEPEYLRGLITDDERAREEMASYGIPTFDLDDHAGVAALIRDIHDGEGCSHAC